MGKRKMVSKDEYEAVLCGVQSWRILEVEKDSLPECIMGYPLEKLAFVAASGSVSTQETENGDEVAGIDVFRYAEERDGVKYNKEHFPIIVDTSTGEKYLVGPFKDDEHWVDEIPKRFKDLDVVRIRKRASECPR